MRAIIKRPEPASLTAHRKTGHSDYDNYEGMDELRLALVTEQLGLCCYCMGRIRDDPAKMKIEHWHCQSRHPDEQLSYRNLLGACYGGEGQGPNFQHCDTRKGDQDLLWNPAERSHQIESRIRYELDGTIRSDDVVFNLELDHVLNLNLAVLKNNRKGVLDAILYWWKKEKSMIHDRVPRASFERERERITAGAGNLAPYCQVAVWWLQQRLLSMA